MCTTIQCTAVQLYTVHCTAVKLYDCASINLYPYMILLIYTCTIDRDRSVQGPQPEHFIFTSSTTQKCAHAFENNYPPV